ncbi:MAG TPA: hypothetical protein PKD90_08860 [Phnomibacter sp.]|nr:hypothetical protein [Phnomibacter sp.]
MKFFLLLLPTVLTISAVGNLENITKGFPKDDELLNCLEIGRLEDCTELKNDPEIRQEIQDLANSASIKLMGCCSSYGGRDVKAEVHWDKDENGVCQTRVSKLSNKLIITMTASWRGSLTGTFYWIKGRLIMGLDDKQISWEKISDSGGFPAGCGQRCI